MARPLKIQGQVSLKLPDGRNELWIVARRLLALVMAHVFLLIGEHQKIGRLVVVLVPIFMVNDFRPEQLPPQAVLRDQSMLQDMTPHVA